MIVNQELGYEIVHFYRSTVLTFFIKKTHVNLYTLYHFECGPREVVRVFTLSTMCITDSIKTFHVWLNPIETIKLLREHLEKHAR